MAFDCPEMIITFAFLCGLKIEYDVVSKIKTKTTICILIMALFLRYACIKIKYNNFYVDISEEELRYWDNLFR